MLSAQDAPPQLVPYYYVLESLSLSLESNTPDSPSFLWFSGTPCGSEFTAYTQVVPGYVVCWTVNLVPFLILRLIAILFVVADITILTMIVNCKQYFSDFCFCCCYNAATIIVSLLSLLNSILLYSSRLLSVMIVFAF